MANLVLIIKNGDFVESNGKYQNKFEKKRVEGNGWIARIEKDGTIKCEAKRTCSDGEYCIRYNVKNNGYAKLTLKTPNSKEVKNLRYGFVTPKGEGIKNGVLTLSGGRIDERFAYFRCESFIKLLKKYNLKGIKHINPNTEYSMIESTINGVKRSDTVQTDGIPKAISKKLLMHDKKTGNTKYECKVKVNNASWAIICSNGMRFLYTEVQDIDKLSL